ncbi:hypothetical protein PT974_11797 [Cladobotryum mycophilum]|uniref:Uncharacterized protein n=1 Tax=Cladobotryum mycophilum TaxID=491253 RepID=A0ABR0S795_9HYPO
MDPVSEPLRSAPAPVPPAAAAAAAVGGPETGPGTVVHGDSIANETTTKPLPVVAADPAITATHLARFEFSDHGTKVLMVEWYPGAAALPTPADDLDHVPSPDRKSGLAALTATSIPSRGVSAALAADTSEWSVSWPGKSTTLPARDTDENGTRRRVYFMLPSDVPVPGTVTVSRPGHQTLVLKPLPAIFPERFEAESGPRGVLHTIWAKKRLVELDREMEAELRTNAESVGLEMTLAEKQWVVDNFLRTPQAPVPMTPRSPIPGRLGDKLRGLRLATSPLDLVPSPTANTFTGLDNTLSPLRGDIAVSSFSAIARGNAIPAAVPAPTAPMSLDAALNSGTVPPRIETQEEDDLFALPMSPRSPDMIKSPFSALGARPF